jgi:hypothetical protein
VILDCCHAALMSRNIHVLPKALAYPLRLGIEARLEEIVKREKSAVLAEALQPQGNDKAVRLAAYRTEQSAYEY